MIGDPPFSDYPIRHRRMVLETSKLNSHRGPFGRAQMNRNRLSLAPIAALALLQARILVALRPRAAIIARLRTHSGLERAAHPSAADIDWLIDAAWAIQGMATRLPWRTDCLVRVIAADLLVRRRGLVPIINFQAGKNRRGRFEGHAWLQCEGIAVSGGPAPSLHPLQVLSP